MWDLVFVHAKILENISHDSYQIIDDGVLAVVNGRIDFVGLISEIDLNQAKQVIDLNGKWILPGLIDCHTHLVFAGDRSHEFEMRQQGKSYAEIAKAGGGIVSTVAATRAASFDELYVLAAKRLQTYFSQGVTTVEIKSGYGLELEAELKQLCVARKLAADLPMNIKTTFLGAHAVPKEYQGEPDKYIDYVCQEMLPRVADENLADFVDVFTESIGFNLVQSEKVFEAAAKYNLKIKCHAEQLTHMGAANLASGYGAVSVDHIEYINTDDIQTLKQNQTTAVLLPGAYYFLREKKQPPVQALSEAGVPIALATDFNPGSSPTNQLHLIMNQACIFWNMTPQDALKGITSNAAKALGISDNTGDLSKGKQADCSIWDITHPRDLACTFDLKACYGRVVNGDFHQQ